MLRATVADSGGQRLEVVDRARVVGIVIATAQHRDAVGQRAVLRETAPDREQHAGAEDDEQDRVVPQDAVRGDHESVEGAINILDSSR